MSAHDHVSSCARGSRTVRRTHLIVTLPIALALWMLASLTQTSEAASAKKKGRAETTRKAASATAQARTPSLTSAASATLYGTDGREVGHANMVLVIVCTVLLTLLVVGTTVGVIATCVLVRLLRRDRARSHEDGYPLLAYPAMPRGHGYGELHHDTRVDPMGARAGEASPLLQTIVQHYATATPAQRLQLAHLFTSPTEERALSPHPSSSTPTRFGTQPVTSSATPEFGVSTVSAPGGSRSATGSGSGSGSADNNAVTSTGVAAGPVRYGAPLALMSTTTAPPLGSSSVDVSVENTPGHAPHEPFRQDRSPMMLGAPAVVSANGLRQPQLRLPASRAFARGASTEVGGHLSMSSSLPAATSPITFQPTSAKDEDVLNTTRESRYNLVRRIGDGAFSSVYLVTRKTDGRPFAMKYMVCLNDKERATALRECEIIHSVQGHLNVIQIADMFMSFQFQSTAGAGAVPAPTSAAGIAATAPTSPSLWGRPMAPSPASDMGTPSSIVSATLMLPPPAQSYTGLAPMVMAAATTTTTVTAANVTGRLTPPLSPKDTVDSWLSTLSPAAATKARVLLEAAEAARATVNLTDLFRELATATAMGAPGMWGPGGVGGPAPAPIGGADNVGTGAWDALEDAPSSPAQQFSLVDLDGFILSETDTERLMEQARRVRQRRTKLSAPQTNATTGAGQPPLANRPPLYVNAPATNMTTTAATTTTTTDGPYGALPVPLSAARGGESETAATALTTGSSVVTPYAELLQQVASAHNTSSSSSSRPARATPLISAAAPSSSAKSSPGLHSYRSSNHSQMQAVIAAMGMSGSASASATAAAAAATVDASLTPMVELGRHPRSPPPTEVTKTDWWSPSAPVAVTAPVVGRGPSAHAPPHPSPPAATAISYAPVVAAPTAAMGPRRRTAYSSTDSVDSDASSTGGLAEEPLQPVYRNALLYAAAGATQQRRREAAAAAAAATTTNGDVGVTSSSGITSASVNGKDDSGGERSPLVPWLSEDGLPTTATAGGTGMMATPIRYTGLANYSHVPKAMRTPQPAASSSVTRPGALSRAPSAATVVVPSPSGAVVATTAESSTTPASYAPRMPMSGASYAPMQYRNMLDAAPIHFSNFMASATSGTALNELLAEGEAEEDLEDEEEVEVEDLDVLEGPSAAAAQPLSSHNGRPAPASHETVEEATTVAEAIRFARSGLVGECMHTNDGKPHVTQAVLQRLPSYAPVSMGGTGASGSGLHVSPSPPPAAFGGAEFGSGMTTAPLLRAPNMPPFLHAHARPMASSYAPPSTMYAPGMTPNAGMGQGPVAHVAPPPSPPAPPAVASASTAVSALRATTTATNVTSTVTTRGALGGTAAMGGTGAGAGHRAAPPSLFATPYSTSSHPGAAATGSPTVEDTNSSRHTGYSQRSFPSPHAPPPPAPPRPSLHSHHTLHGLPHGPASSSLPHAPFSPDSSLSSVANAAAPATVAARHGGYLCLVMEYHPMGDLSRYVLRNQQVLATEARRHQRCLTQRSSSNPSHSASCANMSMSLGTPAGAVSAVPAAGATTTTTMRGSATGMNPADSPPRGANFFEPRASPIDGASSSYGKASTLFTNTRSAGLTGTSMTMNSSNHTLSSARSTTLSTAADVNPPSTSPLPRPASYDALLALATTDPTALNPLSEPQLLSIAHQLASVLRHLHTQNPPIVHRDLKPENILIKGDPRELLAEVLEVTASTTNMSSGSRLTQRDGVENTGGQKSKNYLHTNNNNEMDGEAADEDEVIDLDAEGQAHEGGAARYSPSSARSYSPHSPVSASSQQTTHTNTNLNGTAVSGGSSGDRRTLANTRTMHKIIPIVVTDFGLSMVQEAGPHGKRAGRGGGTRPYIAPESWKGLTSTASDIWGYGCVLYALATGRLAARNVRIMSEEARREGFASMILNDILSRRYSLAFASFVVSLLVVDPQKRPTAAMAERCFKVTADEVRFDASSPFFSNVLDL